MSRLRYFMRWKEDGQETEVSKEEALEALLTIYKDTDVTRDMLTLPNRIQGVYWDMVVKRECDGTFMVLIPGLWNQTPVGVRYDDNGMRIR